MNEEVSYEDYIMHCPPKGHKFRLEYKGIWIERCLRCDYYKVSDEEIELENHSKEMIA
jgi:hypothetical protein